MKKKLECILMIDDDEPTNFLNRMLLEKAGCAACIRVAQSGRDALDYLIHTVRTGSPDSVLPAPDLIFLDINMPAMDGWEFIELYKSLKEEQKAKVVIVMLTTSLNPEDEQRARAMPEIAGFVNKPLTLQRIGMILEKHFPHLF